MKILDDEERNAHWNEVLYQGLKGTVVGVGLSALLVAGVRSKYPASYRGFSASVKAGMWAMPTITMAAFYADDGSAKFDEQMHRGRYLQEEEQERREKWNKLLVGEKTFTVVNDNKYRIILAAWAGSLWGSWTLVNRDRYMTTAQKAVQARVYAQAITVVLLLGTLLLNMHERKLHENDPAPVPEWKKVLAARERESIEASAA